MNPYLKHILIWLFVILMYIVAAAAGLYFIWFIAWTVHTLVSLP